MNRYQVNIIWLGLILIALNIIVNLSELKSVIFGGGNGSGNTAQGIANSTGGTTAGQAGKAIANAFGTSAVVTPQNTPSNIMV